MKIIGRSLLGTYILHISAFNTENFMKIKT